MATLKEIPKLQKMANSRWELIVDGKPYLILGGELQNSSMSPARYMSTVWQKLKDMGLNAVLGAVAWEDTEPEEGIFDSKELDQVISGALAQGLRLVILWFGSFKNGRSSYTPSWVKTNPQRFPRMYKADHDGCLQNSGVLSVFYRECAQVDAKAFYKLLQHLKETDKEHVIIMVQVENEVGFHGDSRDHSDAATRAFTSQVPSELVSLMTHDWDSLHPDLRHRHLGFKDIVLGTRPAHPLEPGETFLKRVYGHTSYSWLITMPRTSKRLHLLVERFTEYHFSPMSGPTTLSTSKVTPASFETLSSSLKQMYGTSALESIPQKTCLLDSGLNFPAWSSFWCAIVSLLRTSGPSSGVKFRYTARLIPNISGVHMYHSCQYLQECALHCTVAEWEGTQGGPGSRCLYVIEKKSASQLTERRGDESPSQSSGIHKYSLRKRRLNIITFVEALIADLV